MEHVTDSVKKFMLAGVGAAALTAEHAQKMAQEFVKKGESIVNDGKSSNQELKHEVKSKVKTKVKDALHLEDDYSDEESVEQILKRLTPEERQILRDKLDHIEKEEAEQDYKEVKQESEKETSETKEEKTEEEA